MRILYEFAICVLAIELRSLYMIGPVNYALCTSPFSSSVSVGHCVMVPTWGVRRKIFSAHRDTIAPRPAADSARACPYHSGLYLSGISEMRMAARNPAKAPPR